MAEDLDAALTQARLASRWLALYTQRLQDILRVIDNGLQGLGFRFERWQPMRHLGPPSPTTAPFGRWAWDFLPLLATRYRWVGDDALVEIEITLDSGFAKGAGEGQPDPTQFAEASACSSPVLIRVIGLGAGAPLQLDLSELADREAIQSHVVAHVAELIGGEPFGHVRVEPRSALVIGTSAKRLPFEATGPARAYRDGLRRSIRQLRALPEHYLIAELHTEADGFFDVENVLLYNVGTSCFEHLVEHGLAFRRVEDSRGVKVTYESGRRPDWFDEAEPAASFETEAGPLRSGTKPHSVWWATTMREERAQVNGAFGLDIALTMPEGVRTNLASLVKPLVDGIIAALQTDASPDREAVRRLAAALGVDEADVEARLRAPGPIVSAGVEEPLVRAYREGVQWNPADDRCVAVVLKVERGEQWRVRGRLFDRGGG